MSFQVVVLHSAKSNIDERRLRLSDQEFTLGSDSLVLEGAPTNRIATKSNALQEH
jgi:hypothetical protein